MVVLFCGDNKFNAAQVGFLLRETTNLIAFGRSYTHSRKTKIAHSFVLYFLFQCNCERNLPCWYAFLVSASHIFNCAS